MNKRKIEKIAKKLTTRMDFRLKHPEYLNDRDIVLAAIKEGYPIDNLPNKEFLHDRDIILAAVDKDPKAFEYASDDLKRDEEFVKSLISLVNDDFEAAPIKVTSQNAIAKHYLENVSKEEFIDTLNSLPELNFRLPNTGRFVRDSLGKFEDDEEVVKAALRVDPLAMYGASKRLCSDYEFMKEAIKISKGAAYQYSFVTEEKQQETLANMAMIELIKEPTAVDFLIPGNMENIFATIYEDRELYEELKNGLKQQKEKYTKEGNQVYVDHVTNKLNRLEELEKKMVKEETVEEKEQTVEEKPVAKEKTVTQPKVSGKEAKEIALALGAVAKNGRVLRTLGENLKNNKTVVLKAVTQDGTALEFASPEMKKDKEVVLAAVTQDKRAFKYASPELQKDADVRKAAGMIVEEVKTRKSTKMQGNYDNAPAEVKAAYDEMMKKSFTSLLDKLTPQEIAYLNSLFKDACKDIDTTKMTAGDGETFAFYTKINNRFNKLAKLNEQVLEETEEDTLKEKEKVTKR